MLETDGNDFRLTIPARLVVATAGGRLVVPQSLAKSLMATPVAEPTSEQLEKPPEPERRIVEGVVVTPTSRDEHGEIVLPSALELDYFEKQGRMNWDHMKGPHAIIGEPWKWRLNPSEWYLWCLLYKGLDYAEAAYKLLRAGATLAYSVEGRTTARDPRDKTIITRARVHNVALTHNPVNAETYAKLSDDLMAKSLEQASIDVLHKALSTSTGASIVAQSLEGARPESDREVFARHLSAVDDMAPCACMDGDGGDMHFVHGHDGALLHFHRCCGASVAQAARMAEKHDALARKTGRILEGAT